MSAEVTIQHIVPSGYQPGDYARLHGNGGSGEIDWNNPLDTEQFDLFPNGAGIYGWYHGPWCHFAWGRAHSTGTPGWCHLPWGRFPWYHGTGIIDAKYVVDSCGDYKFGFKCYDQLGNAHTGTPDEAEVIIHIAPLQPTGLEKNTYDKETDILVLNAAT